ncbi:MAG: cytochrome c oxidase subunit II [Acidimicrobiales bacterium]|jgi:cytochrome c oxidase subunit 2
MDDGYGGHHFRRVIGIWAVLAAVADVLFYVLAGPHIPPGTMTSAANGAQFDFNVLFLIALPVLLAVWVYLAYSVWTWRAARGRPEPTAGPYSRGHVGIQTAWIATTTAIVLGLFIFGTYELVVPAGAGGGEGPNPAWAPASHNVLPIQVIAQQWEFTYRYPTFGGFETSQLVVPADTTIAFHVTSLDVVHSFWAYQLGVKADANPDYDDVAYTRTTGQLGQFTVRCSELCGIWHGAMYDYGHVVSLANFMTWARSTQKTLLAATKLLPPFSWTYTPDANGADGGFYPDSQDPYSNVETYGAVPAQVTGAGK